MIQVPHPTGERNFIVPVEELGLPESHNPEYQNNHHRYYNFKRLGGFLIGQYFRDLERHQVEMPVDQHNWVHRTFDQPAKLPSFADMVETIEEASELGENLKLQENRKGPYFYHQISHIAMKQIHMEYNRLNTNKKAA